MSAVDIAAVARRVADSARPGEQVEAYVVRRRDVDIEIFDGRIESLSSAATAGIGVRVVDGHRQGFAYAGYLDDDVADELLGEARRNVAYATVDEALGCAGPDDVAGHTPPVVDLVAPGFDAMSTDDKVALALELERATAAADPRIRTVESCGYGDARVHAVLANSLGLFAETERTIASISSSAIAAEPDGEDRTGFGYDLARDPAALDPATVAAEAALRATRLLGARQPESRRVPVVLDPFVVQSFCGIIAGTLNAESVAKGRSIFGDRLGEHIAADCVGFVDDPTDPDAFGAAPFDGEGVPTRRNAYIAGGVLAHFAHNVVSARRLGAVTTGNAVRAGYASTPGVGMRSIGFVPGGDDLAALLRRAEGGLYVQSVQGLHSGVNPVSGDFSDGAEGCWIRDGALDAPFREATIASTLQRMLLDVVAVGAEVRMLSSGPAVPLCIGEMTLSGT